MSAEDKIKELGIDLGTPAAAAGSYVPVVRTGKLLYVSGQLPARPDGSRPTGRLGENVTVDEGYEAARLCGISLLSQVNAYLGNLNRVKRVVKLTGFVNATPEFVQHPQVVNGASELMSAVFDEKGLHARAAVGVASLPAGVPVEVEMVVELV